MNANTQHSRSKSQEVQVLERCPWSSDKVQRSVEATFPVHVLPVKENMITSLISSLHQRITSPSANSSLCLRAGKWLRMRLAGWEEMLLLLLMEHVNNTASLSSGACRWKKNKHKRAQTSPRVTHARTETVYRNLGPNICYK